MNEKFGIVKCSVTICEVIKSTIRFEPNKIFDTI